MLLIKKGGAPGRVLRVSYYILDTILDTYLIVGLNEKH